MDLRKTTFEVRLKQIPRQFLFTSTLHKVVTGKEMPQQLTSGFNVRIEEQKAQIIIEPSRILLVSELSSRDLVSGFIITLMDRANSVLGIGEVGFIGLRCIYTKTSRKSLDDLKAEFKHKYIKDTPITNAATDYGLPLTLSIDGFHINLSYGPMDSKQLSDFLYYKDENEKKNYYYLELDTNKPGIKFSKRNITSFIAEAFAKQDEVTGLII